MSTQSPDRTEGHAWLCVSLLLIHLDKVPCVNTLKPNYTRIRRQTVSLVKLLKMLSIDFFFFSFGMLGSIDANTGSPDLGWDTDQFPMDVKNATLVMKVTYLLPDKE